MKLAINIQSEKGKEIIKTANERIHITLTRDRVPKYFIYFDNRSIVVEDIPTNMEVLRMEIGQSKS